MVLQETDRGLLVGLAGFRWGAWAWMTTLVVASRGDLVRPGLAWFSVSAAFGVTVVLTVLLRQRPAALLAPDVLVVELVVGAWLFVADGWVYGPSPMGASAPPALGSVWTVTGVIAVAVALGPRWGGAAGAALGVANVVGKAIAADPALSDQVLGMASTAVQHVLAGAGIGFAAVKVRAAERHLARAEARDRVARTLHDGVLQTLAVIQRRPDSAPDLVALARDQERDLRHFLFSADAMPRTSDGLGARLRAVARLHEQRFGSLAEVVIVDDGGGEPEVVPDVAEAVAGAVGEALTNAGKHAGAPPVTIYVEAVGEEVFCSVKDHGDGFDPTTSPEGEGLMHSVRGRMTDVGGRVEVDARPGRGTEVRLWAPRRTTSRR